MNTLFLDEYISADTTCIEKKENKEGIIFRISSILKLSYRYPWYLVTDLMKSLVDYKHFSNMSIKIWNQQINKISVITSLFKDKNINNIVF